MFSFTCPYKVGFESAVCDTFLDFLGFIMFMIDYSYLDDLQLHIFISVLSSEALANGFHNSVNEQFVLMFWIHNITRQVSIRYQFLQKRERMLLLAEQELKQRK